MLMLAIFIFTPLKTVLAQTKEQVSQALDQMKASGAFSSEQIEAARKQMMKMDDKDYQKILNQAKEKAMDPEFQKKTKELFDQANKK